MLITFDDITPLKDAHAQLEEAVRVRQDFLSIAGHELKTPLTSMMLNMYRSTSRCGAAARWRTTPAWGRAGKRSADSSAACRASSISC